MIIFDLKAKLKNVVRLLKFWVFLSFVYILLKTFEI